VTAYALAFGSLLLAGGRLGDLIGRKVTFLAGAATSFGVRGGTRGGWRIAR
jgi:MFS family permease